jgi:hypothetical protein
VKGRRFCPLGQINKICGPSHLKDAELLQAIDKRIASIDKALDGLEQFGVFQM